MADSLKVSRGDVVLLPIAFVSGVGTKLRPAVVLQEDSLNQRLNSTVVAIVTTSNQRAHREPSQLFIDGSTPDEQQTGLLHDSTIKAEHLDTVDQRDILRVIGHLADNMMAIFETCVKSALRLP